MKENTETIDAEVIEETTSKVEETTPRWKKVAKIAAPAAAAVLAITAVVIIKTKAGGNVVPE